MVSNVVFIVNYQIDEPDRPLIPAAALYTFNHLIFLL